jgi:hypothetical protein
MRFVLLTGDHPTRLAGKLTLLRGLALYQMGQKQPVPMCKTQDMNQAIPSKRAIRQDSGETLDRVRKEIGVSPVTRSAREGLEPCFSNPDFPEAQRPLRIEDEPKSRVIAPQAKMAARRQARWLFHYVQEPDRPARHQNPNLGAKRTNKRHGE